MRSRISRSRPNAALSSRSMCRLKPTTSANKTAASLRVTALRFTGASGTVKNGEAKP
jgi:hypothetical protein